MKLIKIFLLFFLISFSFLALADTYPATIKYVVLGKTPYYYDLTRLGACSHWGGTMHSNGFDCVINGNQHGVVSESRCDYGGAWNGTLCADAPSCPVGQARDSITGECKSPPALNCGANEYDNAGVCTPIPDCNADAPLGRNFFDVETKSCKTIEGVGTICIGEAAPKYCPPIDDCKPDGYICSNEPKEKAIEDAARVGAVAAAAAAAADKKAQIEEIASAAATAAAAKASEHQAAKDALQSAKDALAAAKASGDQAAIAAAIKDYGKALAGVQDAAARQANSQKAADSVAQTNGSAGTEQAQIPSSNPGNASAHDKNIGDMMPGAITGLDDAISGDGSGTGRGSGVSTSTSQTSIDTSGLATDSTAKGIESNTQGILDALGNGTKGTLASAPDSFYTSEYSGGMAGVWDSHKAAISQTPFMNAVSGLTPAVGDSGSLPSWTLPPVPFLTSASYEFQTFPEMWGFLRIIFIVTALFTARSLVFGG
jgi:hypothetical protein